MNRRSFLLGSGGALTSACMVGPSLATTDAGQAFALESIHRDTARAARDLAAGQELVLKILLPNGCLANVEPVANSFREATGIGFQYLETPVDEINSRMIIDTLSGSGTFDLALPATFGLPDLVEAGALADLDAFAHRYEPADFQQDALFSLGDYYKGTLYGYQTDGDAYLMFYNRDWLEDGEQGKRFADRHGYDLSVPTTWQELDAMMAFFHRPDEKRYGGALFRTANYIAWEFWIRFHAKGRWPFDEDLRPMIDGDAGIEALEELIAASKSLYPAAGVNGLFENWEAFAQGNIFCNIGWGGTQKYLNGPNSKVKGKLAFAPTPGGLVDGRLVLVPYFNWGWNYTVSSGSRVSEIAYLFALFACSPEMSTRSVREAGGYFDPFRTKHYDDPQIIETYSEAFLDAHRESMVGSIPDLYLKGQGEYFDALRQNLVLANSGRVSARDALARTAKQWRLTTRRLGHDSQTEQWAFLRSQYPADLRAALS